MIAKTFLSLLFPLLTMEMMAQSSYFNTIGKERKKVVEVIEEEENSMLECDSTEITENPSINTTAARDMAACVALPLKRIKITSPFGKRIDPLNRKKVRWHSGLDLRARYEEVYAMLPGNIIKVGYDKAAGHFVKIAHGDVMVSYCHLSKVLVKEGWHIKSGEIVAVSGNSGKRTTGAHLHITCKMKENDGQWKYFNPNKVLAFVLIKMRKGE